MAAIKGSDGAIDIGRRLEGVRIVVADDSEDERDMIAFVFAREGADVTTVESTAQALEAIRVHRPDVLVSDIALAQCDDGYRLVRELRILEQARGGKTPAVALTGWARESDRMAAIDAGFQVHLSKPVDISTLVTVVASLASAGSPAA